MCFVTVVLDFVGSRYTGKDRYTVDRAIQEIQNGVRRIAKVNNSRRIFNKAQAELENKIKTPDNPQTDTYILILNKTQV